MVILHTGGRLPVLVYSWPTCSFRILTSLSSLPTDVTDVAYCSNDREMKLIERILGTLMHIVDNE